MISRRGLLALLGVLVLGVLALSCVTVVDPGEVVVVRRLGKVLPDAWGPGLHLGLPRGVDRGERIRLEEVRKIEVGLAGLAGPNDDPGDGEFLTGDHNLLQARAVVQYRVDDAIRYVLSSSDLDKVLVRLSEAAMNRVFTRAGVDDVLREARGEVARRMASDLADRARSYGLGVRILGVSFTDIQVPIEVLPDFSAAQSAESGKETRLFEAKSKAETMLIAAKGQAKAIEESARTDSARNVVLAKARAASFLVLLDEFGRARHLTVQNLYLDAIRTLIPKIRRKVLLTPEEPVDLTIFGIDSQQLRSK